jgi:Na+-driven multidrug efflux pump
MVIVFLFIGQLLGSSWFGPQGATWGAMIGALAGFFIGTVSVYRTIGYLDKIEAESRAKKPYMPPMEEILEDVKFDLEEDE